MDRSLRTGKISFALFLTGLLMHKLFYYGSRALGLCLVFLCIYPLYFKFLPVPTDRLIELLGFGVLAVEMLFRRDMKFDRRLLALFPAACCMAFFSFLVAFFAPVRSLYMVKWFFDIILTAPAYFFIIRYLQAIYPDLSLARLLDYLVYAAVIQALLSFYFFLNPPEYERFLSLLNADVNSGIAERIGLLKVRLLGVGNSFFTAVLNYGMALLIACLLPYLRASSLYRRKWLFWPCLFLIVAAGLLSARTFLFAIILALAFIFLMEHRRIVSFAKRTVKFLLFFAALAAAASFFLFRNIDPDRLKRVSQFAFEIFYNLAETGKLGVHSTDVLASMARFPSNDKTWLIGDGLILNGDGSYYQRTDIGWLRMLYYFGTLGIILFLALQVFYFTIIASLHKHRAVKWMLFFFFLFLLILNIKGLVNIDKYLILFALAGTILKERTDSGPA